MACCITASHYSVPKCLKTVRDHARCGAEVSGQFEYGPEVSVKQFPTAGDGVIEGL